MKFTKKIMLLFPIKALLFCTAYSMDSGPHAQREQEELLFKASNGSDVQAIKKLVEEKKVNINARNTWGKTPLSIAASYGSEEVVVQLLTYKPDVNLANKYGWTPLKKAVNNGRLNVAKILLAAGACVDQQDDEGYTPLMNVDKNHEIAQLLLQHGADVNHQAFKDGTTALILAVTNNRERLVTVLIAAGAHDNMQRHFDKKNAREIARLHGESHLAILEILEEKFGK